MKVQIPYAYADAYFWQMMAAYGPQINSQMYDSPRARVPLPDLAEDEPIYVNANSSVQFSGEEYHVLGLRLKTRCSNPKNHIFMNLDTVMQQTEFGDLVGASLPPRSPRSQRYTALTQEQKNASSTNVHLSLENRSTMASSMTFGSDITCGSDGRGGCGVFDTRSIHPEGE